MKAMKHRITAIKQCLKSAPKERVGILREWLKEDKEELRRLELKEIKDKERIY